MRLGGCAVEDSSGYIVNVDDDKAMVLSNVYGRRCNI